MVLLTMVSATMHTVLGLFALCVLINCHSNSVSFAVRIYIILYFVDSKRYSKVFLTYLL